MRFSNHRVPGSIHSHTVILVVVNYDSSHSCPDSCCHSALTTPPTPPTPPTLRPLRPPPTYSSHTHSHKARWVKRVLPKDTTTMTQVAGRGSNHRPSEQADPLQNLSHGRPMGQAIRYAFPFLLGPQGPQISSMSKIHASRVNKRTICPNYNSQFVGENG